MLTAVCDAIVNPRLMFLNTGTPYGAVKPDMRITTAERRARDPSLREGFCLRAPLTPLEYNSTWVIHFSKGAWAIFRLCGQSEPGKIEVECVS
jgi:hypothetical protein